MQQRCTANALYKRLKAIRRVLFDCVDRALPERRGSLMTQIIDRQHREELMSLLADYCDGSIEQVAGMRLEAILRQTSEARSIYVKYLELHLNLRRRGRQIREDRESLATSPETEYAGVGSTDSMGFRGTHPCGRSECPSGHAYTAGL